MLWVQVQGLTDSADLRTIQRTAQLQISLGLVKVLLGIPILL